MSFHGPRIVNEGIIHNERTPIGKRLGNEGLTSNPVPERKTFAEALQDLLNGRTVNVSQPFADDPPPPQPLSPEHERHVRRFLGIPLDEPESTPEENARTQSYVRWKRLNKAAMDACDRERGTGQSQGSAADRGSRPRPRRPRKPKEPVALHHYGDPRWQNPLFNQGVPIELIRRRIDAKGFGNSLGA